MLQADQKEKYLSRFRELCVNYKKSYIEGVLVKTTNERYAIYYAKIVFSNNFNKKDFTETIDNKAVCFRVIGNNELAKTFVGLANERSEYYIPNITGLLNKLDIISGWVYKLEEDLPYFRAKSYGLDNPAKMLVLSVLPEINPNELTYKLNRYRMPSLSALVNEKLDLDFQEEGVAYGRNQVLICFENNSGHIKEVSTNETGIIVSLQIDENKKELYELILYLHERKKPISVKVTGPIVQTTFKSKATSQIILLFDGKDIDTYYYHVPDQPTRQTAKEHDFFICHAIEDFELAKTIKEILENNGKKAFLAHKELVNGEPWHYGIIEKLRKSDKMIIIATNNLENRSKYSHYEIGFAEAIEITPNIIALEKSDTFQEYIRIRQLDIVDAKNPNAATVKKFLERLIPKLKITKEEEIKLQQALDNYYQKNNRPN